jgi:ubiquinone biosynthesis protein UbiJ
MGIWASWCPRLCLGQPLSAAAAMLSLEGLFDPHGSGNLRIAVDLRLPDSDFAVRVKDGRLSIETGRNPDPDCVLTGDHDALPPVLRAGKSAEAAVAGGSLKAEGETDALARLATAFRSPKPMLA